MKVEWNKKYSTISVYVILVMVITLLTYHFLNNFHYFKGVFNTVLKLLSPFFYGFAIAYILHPVLKWCENIMLPFLSRGKLSKRTYRYLGILFTLLFAILIVAVFFSIVIPEVTNSIRDIVLQMGTYVTKFQDLINNLIIKYKNNEMVVSLLQGLASSTEQIIKQFLTIFTQSFSEIISATINITSAIVNIVIGTIISVYLWGSKESFFAQIKKFLSSFCSERVLERLIRLTHKSNYIFSGFISGQLLDSLIVGCLCFIGMQLIGLPYSMLISVLIGVTNIIPYFGPFIGSVPSILLLLLLNPIDALWFAIFILILQQIDGNIISPRILGGSTGLPAVWVVFAVTVFGGMLGFVGMIIGVPLFAVIYMLIKHACEIRLEKKGLPTETAAYASDENPLLPPKIRRKHKKGNVKKRS